MGAVDMERQAPNVDRMHRLGAECVAVETGDKTLRAAIDDGTLPARAGINRYVWNLRANDLDIDALRVLDVQDVAGTDHRVFLDQNVGADRHHATLDRFVVLILDRHARTLVGGLGFDDDLEYRLLRCGASRCSKRTLSTNT